MFYVRIFYEKDKNHKEESFRRAIEYCIEHNILKDYLEANMSEVCNFLLAEYDYDTDIAVQRDEAYKVGVETGREEGIEMGMEKGIEMGRVEGREEGIEMRNIMLARSFRDMGVSIDKIAKATGLTEEEIASL